MWSLIWFLPRLDDPQGAGLVVAIRSVRPAEASPPSAKTLNLGAVVDVQLPVDVFHTEGDVDLVGENRDPAVGVDAEDAVHRPIDRAGHVHVIFANEHPAVRGTGDGCRIEDSGCGRDDFHRPAGRAGREVVAVSSGRPRPGWPGIRSR